ncbi:hypothetical protein [uncultured Clostridium sp.]|uniref:hypothetical protein n=1 Tax=uncultured Clostridium sp. TaxID=59620 RepID=UPI00260952E6|nr:hypothetical protein [uncultured Clostridium sp.]
MKELFKIGDVSFTQEEFQDDINEYLDIVDIVKEFEGKLKLEEIECAQINDCCGATKFNLFAEIIGVLTEQDTFLTLLEVRAHQSTYEGTNVEPFGIQIYKCKSCNKWMFWLLESGEE